MRRLDNQLIVLIACEDITERKEAGNALRQSETYLAEAQRLSKGYSSLASVEKSTWYDEPKIRALAEATYFRGLRQAGLPAE